MKPAEYFRCCQHCVDPCPANGHTRRCPDCKPGAVEPIVMEPFELVRSVPR